MDVDKPTFSNTNRCLYAKLHGDLAQDLVQNRLPQATWMSLEDFIRAAVYTETLGSWFNVFCFHVTL